MSSQEIKLGHEILLGYEIGTGDPVHIAPQHMVTLGMTQLSGKTTTNQAIIVRSGAKAVAFITKRGESGFIDFNLMRPYYKSQQGWQYVESLIDVALGEKVKYEPRMRYAIMKVSRGMKDLRDVREKAVKYLQEAKKEWDKEVYSKLIAYLDLVLPELEAIDFADKVELKDGINVMNLVDMKLETQQLIIASTLQYIYQHLSDVIVIIPEAWEHLPQSRRTPVKFVAEQFIRKGASVRNYLWLDSQDIGGIDKTPLRQVSTWIMGRMMEAHEVERILKQLLGFKIPAHEIQTLPLGHFYVTVGNKIQKVYVLPSGISEEIGIEVAKGIRTPQSVKKMLDEKRREIREDDDLVWKEKYDEEHRIRKEFEKTLGEYSEDLKKLQGKIKELEQGGQDTKLLETRVKTLTDQCRQAEEDLKVFDDFRNVMRRMFPQQNQPSSSQTIQLQSTKTIVDVPAITKTATINDANIQGKILTVAKKGFLDNWRKLGEIVKAIKDESWNASSQQVNNGLTDLVKQQLIAKKHTDRNYFKLAKNVTFKET